MTRCGEPWPERYEDLRCQALKGNAADHEDGRGLVLVLRRGLVNWMQAWPRPSAASERGARSASELPSIDLTSPVGHELAHILATVILQQRQEVFA